MDVRAYRTAWRGQTVTHAWWDTIQLEQEEMRPMASSRFTRSEWDAIRNCAATSAEAFGLPLRRNRSVILGTFNIRELGRIRNRSRQAWELLTMICHRFDLLALQEVADDLEGVKHIKQGLGDDFGMVVSDMTGVFPGDRGNPERLAFLFNWHRVQRTELASDITYDRSQVIETLFNSRSQFQKAWQTHALNLEAWRERVLRAREAGGRTPSRPGIALPMFLTFIRQPHCASFQIPGANGARPVQFLAVNVHLLYGDSKLERLWEFEALVDWLALRAKQRGRTYHENMLLMGDCNLEFENAGLKREEIDARLKKLNSTKLKSARAAKVNFPLLTSHPAQGYLKTNARQDQTYDQIAIFAHDARLPSYEANKSAGHFGDDEYDYGVFSFVDLFAEALHGVRFEVLGSEEQDYIYLKAKQEISDHMPAWIRLPIPDS